tara:strand:- start:87 stop:371 length:285 start_codon:yes stop_codon:yes gene_type:complete
MTRYVNLINGIEVPMTEAEITVRKAEEAQALQEQSQNNNIEQAPYINQRKNAYPEIGDQLDMLWHTMDKDMELQHKFYDFYQTIKKVKVAHPKK